MQHALARLGFVYKKTKRVPGKADAKKQREFVKQHEKLKPTNPIYFMDGTIDAQSTMELLKQLEALHQKACRTFFEDIKKFQPELRTLLRDKFQIIDPVF